MVPRYRPLIYICYKYNAHKALYLIDTEDAGSITDLSNYPDPFANVAINPVSRPLVMYKLFVSVNEVYSHKNPGNLI